MGTSWQTDLADAGIQLSQDEHGSVVYMDRLGKIKMEIFPKACHSDDLYKAINFLQTIVAQKGQNEQN